MKKHFITIGTFLAGAAALIALMGLVATANAVYPLQEVGGGLGTNATSSAGQVPISTGSSTYTPANLTCVGGCNVTSASGSVQFGVPQLPEIIVSSQAGANFGNNQLVAAVVAANNTTTYPNGAEVYLPDLNYTVTSTMSLAAGVNIVGGPAGTFINFLATSTGSLSSPGSVLFNAASSGVSSQNIGLWNLNLKQTSTSYAGTALDWSNVALANFSNVRSFGFMNGRYANDTKNNTFYNTFYDWRSSDRNCMVASSTNSINQNSFYNDRCSTNADSGATSTNPAYGLYFNKGNDNKWYSPDFEPAAGNQSSTFGIDMLSDVSNDTFGNAFFGVYEENNQTGTIIGANVLRTLFVGGQVILSKSTDWVDSGLDTETLNYQVGSGGVNQSHTQLPWFTAQDNTANSRTYTFENNTTFAHTGSTLVTMSMLNGSDASNVLKITNAGASSSLLVQDGSSNNKFNVTNNTTTISNPTVVSSSLTQSGGTVSLSSTTITGQATTTNLTVTNNTSLGNTTSTANITAATLNASSTLTVGSSTLKNTSTTFQVVGPGNTLSASSSVPIFIGDASSSRPGCIVLSAYPTGTAWTYLYVSFLNGGMTGSAGAATFFATTTPCN